MNEDNQELVKDLEQRIDTLENSDEAEFGSFSRTDYVILIIVGVILPIVALVAAR
jgi:hypothetical protein